MKKEIYLFGAVLVLTSTLTLSCTKQEQPKKNYYGVTPENQGVSQAAYYTFAGLIIALAVFLAWGWKKIKKG